MELPLRSGKITFPQAFIDRSNKKNISGKIAEAVIIDQVKPIADPTEYL